MSSDDPNRKGQDFLQIVTKAKEFTEELLKENERLRFKLANLETGGSGAGATQRGIMGGCSGQGIRRLGHPQSWRKLRKKHCPNAMGR